jgi:UDP-2,3-diacylglucosamine pyrophosphatase LpxH
MAFCWFTNERMTDGVVQLMPLSNNQSPAADSFSATMTIAATPTITLPLNYATSSSGLLKATKMKPTQEYTYVSHKAIAEGLTPNTTYAYRVGVDGFWSEIGTFTTASDKQEPFSFIYMTDSHIMNQEYIDAARLCATAAAENAAEARFCVFPGDFVETGTNRNSEWEWERWFDEALQPVIKQMPIVPTDGNHDDSENLNYTYHFNTDNQFKENANVKPQFDGTTYSFMYGDVLFLVYSLQDYWKGAYSLTNGTSTYLTNDVGNWFREQVAAHPEAKWRVALVHKNIFSGSSHQEDEETPLFRATMLPIMKECEIDLMLQGHDHCYEVIGPVDPDTRTPILNAIEDLEPTVLSASRNKGGTFTVNDGTLYFIGATCGAKRYSPNSKAVMEADLSKHKVEN